ncbi:coiled-coil domain-containing protein 112-like [Polypterus senegalus]|uniref:coiled-coil domain-containing protein 112-like n=1 Tax=Polypterus senegalus TaxID=55291 RepID=UPI001962F0F8|nr:coiled-coil domain-containing protein 112-like [Polypterus senegalus]
MAALTTEASGETSWQDENFQSVSCHEKEFHIQKWKERNAQAQKADFLKEADKLNKQVIKLEKEKNAQLFHKKNDFRNEFGELEELELKLTSSRNTEKIKFQQQLAKIHNIVKRFQSQLKDVKPTPEFLEKLREVMEEAENSINALKEEQRKIYEELMKQEKCSSQEVIALEKRIEMWTVSTGPISKKPPSPALPKLSAASTNEDLPSEVTDFEKFLHKTGGRQGGWDDYDHQNFLKIWTKHNGKKSYMEEALLYLPGRTQEEIKQHEDWYQEFLFLEERKKEAIQLWKSKKNQEKEKFLKQQEKLEDLKTQKELARVEAYRKKLEQEKEDKQAKLQEWKKKKELELAAEEEKQCQAEVQKRRKIKEEQQRQLEVKAIVETYARQKKEEEMHERLKQEVQEQSEREERQRLSARAIVKFRERDMQKVFEKVLEKHSKEEEEHEREKKIAKVKQKVEAHVTKDPDRLLKPTKGWKEHVKVIGPTGGGPALYMPHRAIPNWRQGL